MDLATTPRARSAPPTHPPQDLPPDKFEVIVGDGKTSFYIDEAVVRQVPGLIDLFSLNLGVERKKTITIPQFSARIFTYFLFFIQHMMELNLNLNATTWRTLRKEHGDTDGTHGLRSLVVLWEFADIMNVPRLQNAIIHFICDLHSVWARSSCDSLCTYPRTELVSAAFLAYASAGHLTITSISLILMHTVANSFAFGRLENGLYTTEAQWSQNPRAMGMLMQEVCHQLQRNQVQVLQLNTRGLDWGDYTFRYRARADDGHFE